MALDFPLCTAHIARARDPPGPANRILARLGEVFRMKKRFVAFLLLFLLAVATGFVPSASAVSAKLDWHVSDSFIQAGTGVTQTGALAQASNGDIARLSGSGTFNMASDKATG